MSAPPLDVNRATYRELSALSGVGPVVARHIEEYRAQHGPISDLDELMSVEGVTPHLMDRLRPQLEVGSGEASSLDAPTGEPTPLLQPGNGRQQPSAGDEIRTRTEAWRRPESAHPAANESDPQNPVVLVVGGAIVGALLSLLVLYLISGTLSFIPRSRLAALETRIATLEGETGRARAELTDLSAQVAAGESRIEAAGTQVAELDTRVAEVEGMRDQVEKALSEVGMLAEDLQTVTGRVDVLGADAARFDGFLDALRSALQAAAEQPSVPF